MRKSKFPHTIVLGQNIRTRRMELGITQSELADLAAIDVSNVGKIERGTTNPRLDTVLRIAVILETSVSKLTKGIKDEHLTEKPRAITVRDLLRAKGLID